MMQTKIAPESVPADAVVRLEAAVTQLCTILTDRSTLLLAGTGGIDPVDDGPASRARLLAAVQGEYIARRRRDEAFGRILFGEPAWDMLVYLYAAHLRGDLVPTSSLARASAVPATTALRWIAQLEQVGLIERCTIKRDGRVRVLSLTKRAVAQLEHHFRARLMGEVGGIGAVPLEPLEERSPPPRRTRAVSKRERGIGARRAAGPAGLAG